MFADQRCKHLHPMEWVVSCEYPLANNLLYLTEKITSVNGKEIIGMAVGDSEERAYNFPFYYAMIKEGGSYKMNSLQCDCDVAVDTSFCEPQDHA